MDRENPMTALQGAFRLVRERKHTGRGALRLLKDIALADAERGSGTIAVRGSSDYELWLSCLGIGVFFRYVYDLERGYIQFGQWEEVGGEKVCKMADGWAVDAEGVVREGTGRSVDIRQEFHPAVSRVVWALSDEGDLRVPGNLGPTALD